EAARRSAPHAAMVRRLPGALPQPPAPLPPPRTAFSAATPADVRRSQPGLHFPLVPTTGGGFRREPLPLRRTVLHLPPGCPGFSLRAARRQAAGAGVFGYGLRPAPRVPAKV